MTLKELATKVETYNEIAGIIHRKKIYIYLYEGISCGDKFYSYAELRKHIRWMYYKEFADMVLKSDKFVPFGEPVRIERIDVFGDLNVVELHADIGEDW